MHSRRDYGITDVIRPGVGFLTFGDLERLAAITWTAGQIFSVARAARVAVSSSAVRLQIGRAPAAFGVWVAQ